MSSARGRATGYVLPRLALAAICLLTFAWPAAAQTPLPTLTAPVNDIAHVIDPASAAELDRIIRVLQATTGDVVVVATVDTFAPYATIEDYALKLFERAGIGTRKADSGALVLLAVKDRRVRIETGYGLEEFITDGFAGETIRTDMLPAFREGRYGPGLVAGTTRVIQRIAEKRGVTLDNVALPAAPQQRNRDSGPSFGSILIFLLFLVLMSKFGGMGGGITPYGRRGGRSTWSGWHGGLGGFGGGFGGGGGGGFGGFGGGRSGGGGASGGW
ncbi:MAG TPA: TPM domain-containing protein [Vicinamibacterales bacterium]|nr:TPM domain-containing protein [Vicinamibacterales bacterium]